MKKTYHFSVRELVEFILRAGDIFSGGRGRLDNERAVLGTRIHRKIEKDLQANGKLVEVFLKYETSFPEFDLTVDGRADAIEPSIDKPVIIEIKSIDLELAKLTEDYNLLHWAQALCYAYIYCLQNKYEKCSVKLIYCNIETFATKEFIKDYTFDELEVFFSDLLKKQLQFLYLLHNWIAVRDESLKELKFPFDKYRDGQRQLAVSVYKNIKSGNKLFAEAPTGIGKTMSTIFPSLKAMGEKLCDRIFYLTAKTTTRMLPKQAVEVLREKSGLKLITTTLYAKEKICKCASVLCNPEDCKYANGHYDRINNAILDALASATMFDMDKIHELSEKHSVCPFEYALDLSLWSDMIICDYNYVFDPNVYLRRFFEEGNTDRFVFLIDEAHNLADRAREMFSISLEKRDFMDFKNYLKNDFPMLSNALSEVNKHFIAKGKQETIVVLEKEYVFSQENDIHLTELITDVITASGEFLEEHPKNEDYDRYLQLYFDMVFYIKISEMYDSNFCTYYRHEGSDGFFKVLCLDPSVQLKKSFEKSVSSVLFSATLIPMKYYFGLLGGADTDNTLMLPSPFVPENRCIISATDISSSYKKRELYYEKTADYIYKTFCAKPGNYISFFPSYKYMQTVYEVFKIKYPDVDTIIQNRKSTDAEREAFIDSFKDDEEQARVGFCVLGGVFSEGIDLKGNRLIGTILVGVGIPQVNIERELIKEYFDYKARENYEALQGFDYSYVYPGFTKILQSAGRVIRSEEDRGVIVLLDERYNSQKYVDIFPSEWQGVQFTDIKGVDGILKEFWQE